MIDQPVTQRMRSLINLWESQSDQRAIFLSCYLLMTENMLRAIETDQFHDSEWVNSFLHRFADYYFNALDTYEHDRDQTPSVWVRVHDAAKRSSTRVIQNLLLGINTHINFDLIFTLVDMLDPEWEQLAPAEREWRHADHDQVNQIIGRTIDTVQDQVLEVMVPEMDLVDKLMGPLDEWMISELITHWRDEVWSRAVDIIETKDPLDREQRKKEFEVVTERRASTILLESGSLDLFGLL